MPKNAAVLPEGARVTDFISLGAVTTKVPIEQVHRVLEETGCQSQRQRKLPAHVMVYYVIALALYMQVSYGEVLRCLVEGLEWLGLPVRPIRTAAKSGISQARSRLGAEPLERLYDEVVGPIAEPDTKGAWYRGWRLVSLDGTTLQVADTPANEEAFGRPGSSRGKSSFPLIRLVTLLETGTHVLFGARHGPYEGASESELAKEAICRLTPEMLCIADRGFFSYELFRRAHGTGAQLLWRVKKNNFLPCIERLPDGSYLSNIYASAKDRRHDRGGIIVRVIEYELDGTDGAELYRLITTLTNPASVPAEELAALYHERWEIEGAFDEFKTHLRGAAIVLRSRVPQLVVQEFYGLLLAHYAVRGLMHDAALKAAVDPDTLSFVHSLRVVRRKLPVYASFPPSAAATTA